MNSQNLAALVELCITNNFSRKRSDNTRLEVIENALSELGLSRFDANTLLTTVIEAVAASKKAVEKVTSKLPANHIAAGTSGKKEKVKIPAGSYLITAAQNNTEVHKPFLTALESLAENLSAEIIALPNWYAKNSYSKDAQADHEFFDPAIEQYLQLENFFVADEKAAIVYANAGINPTQLQPRNSAEHFNQGECISIVASPKQQMKTLPRLNNEPIKFAWSTGTCTKQNYVCSGAGQKAEVDHTYGALWLFVSLDGTVDCTNIQLGDNGSLQVFDGESLTDQKGRPLTGASVVLGDLHMERKDQKVWDATMRYLDDLNPRQIVAHDVSHFESQNHWNIGNDFHQFKMQNQTVLEELNLVTAGLNELADIAPVYLCESNHNSAVDSWLCNNAYDSGKDPKNARLYCLLKAFMYEAFEEASESSTQLALEIALTDVRFQELMQGLDQLSENVVFGRMDEPFILGGYDCSQHGHKGANGSRGTPMQFAKLGLKLITVHTHSAGFIRNCFTVGCKALDQGYNRGGASSWSLVDAIIMPNGTVQMHNVVPSRWC